MSSVEYLRELINEQVTAAAEEIFRVCQQTFSQYEEEINRQRRLLDIVLKPEIKLHRTELPQQHVCKEEEVLADQQLCHQDRNSSVNQEDPDPPRIKEEQEELCTSLEKEKLVLKQETITFMLVPTSEERDNSEDQTLDLNPDETQSAAKKEHVSMVPEPNSDDSAEPKPQKRHHKSKSHANNEESATTLKIHSNTFTGILCCESCGKSFKYKSKLHTHQRVHTGEKLYPCNTCKKRFSQPDGLKVHLRVHTGETPYNCKTCGKGFTRKAVMKRHMKIHTGEKPYPCNTCGKRFTQPSALNLHIRVHTGEKPYPCTTCGKRYNQPSALKLHMRVHTGKKPYSCKTCGKRFTQPSTLNLHMRVHTGKKPYPCNTCEKRFFDTRTLKEHQRVHTGEKPYPCNTCEKRFCKMSALKEHLKVHTGERPYSCKICGRDFRRRYHLKIHMTSLSHAKLEKAHKNSSR